MKRINIALILVLLLASMLVTGCGKKEEKVVTKSMDDIFLEEGVPVEIQAIEKTTLTKSRTYFATMEGVRETSQISAVADRIEEVYYNVGDYVEKDAVVMSFPKDNAMAQFIQVKTQYEDALVTLNRMQKVYDEGGISKQDLDQLSTQVKVLEASMSNVTAMVEVKAPISGIVTEFYVRESDRVFPDDNLFTISELSKLRAEIWVNEDDISLVKKGITAKAMWKGNTLKGKVTAVALNMNSMTKAFRTQIVFDNPKYKIKGGVTADITITLSTKRNVIALDRAYINTVGDKLYTWVNNNNKAEKRFIKTGINNDLLVEITNGLSVGDLLITKGYNRVKEGSKLKVLN